MLNQTPVKFIVHTQAKDPRYCHTSCPMLCIKQWHQSQAYCKAFQTPLINDPDKYQTPNFRRSPQCLENELKGENSAVYSEGFNTGRDAGIEEVVIATKPTQTNPDTPVVIATAPGYCSQECPFLDPAYPNNPTSPRCHAFEEQLQTEDIIYSQPPKPKRCHTCMMKAVFTTDGPDPMIPPKPAKSP